MPYTNPSDLQIKTFQIQNSSDEQTVNEFLSGKVVRHWSASFSPSTSLPSSDGSPIVLGVWNVFVAYENRSEHEARSQGDRSQSDRSHSDRSQGDRSQGDRSQSDYGKQTGRKNLTLAPRGSQRSENSSSKPSASARAEKAPVEDYKPNVPDQDFPLFDAVRKWRNTRARETRVKPYSFFNNRQLEQIVTEKPGSLDALRAIATDMSPELWDKYQAELLAFIDTARAVSGNGPTSLASPEALTETTAEASA